MPPKRPVLLFPDDVAAIWTEERRKEEGPNAPEVTTEKVHDFLRWSKPTPPGNKNRNRYENHPMPYPRGTRGKRQPAWHEDQEDDLRAFWHDRSARAETDEDRVKQRKAEWKEALNK